MPALRVFDELRLAEINELYYRRLAGHLSLADRTVRLLAAITSSVTVVGWAVPALGEGWKVFGVLAAIFTLVSSVFGLGDQSRKYADLATKWTGIVGELRLLDLRREPPPDEAVLAVVGRGEQLQGDDQLPPWRWFIGRCREEVEARHVDRTVSP